MTARIATTLLVLMSLLMLSFGAIIVSQPQVVEAQSAQERLCTGAGGTFSNGECSDPGGNDLFNSQDDNPSIFQRIADLLLFITGAISVIMLIIGGIRYVISQGDQQAVANAKNTILYAVVGLVITFLAFAAVRFVINSLSGTP